MEQIPFKVWRQYNNKTQNVRIALYGLEETVFWGDLDRWNYTNDPQGVPPNISLYTGTSLESTFSLFFIVSGMQFLFQLVVKMINSRQFSKKSDYLNKFLHLVQSLNLATPFEDWDQGRCSVKEYRERHRETNIEMAWSLSVNIVCSMIMLVPLWYTGICVQFSNNMCYLLTNSGYQIRSRHSLLKSLIGTKLEEDQSFESINNCLLYINIIMLLCCAMETVSYYIYNNKVNLVLLYLYFLYFGTFLKLRM